MRLFFKRFFAAFKKTTFLKQQKSIEIPLTKQVLQGYKIVHLSDLHIDKKSNIQELLSLVDEINALDCHIVVITGDILGTKIKYIREKLAVFKNLKHKTYYVSGNHDLVHGRIALQQSMQACGIICLDNRYEILTFKNQKFVLAGLGDRYSSFFRIKREASTLVETLGTLPYPIIFLAHQPKDYIYAYKAKSKLFLCGHTHAGQIYPFTYLVKLTQPFVSGFYNYKDMAIYVNNGLGTWGIDIRFHADAEFTLMKLTYTQPLEHFE